MRGECEEESVKDYLPRAGLDGFSSFKRVSGFGYVYKMLSSSAVCPWARVSYVITQCSAVK